MHTPVGQGALIGGTRGRAVLAKEREELQRPKDTGARGGVLPSLKAQGQAACHPVIVRKRLSSDLIRAHVGETCLGRSEFSSTERIRSIQWASQRPGILDGLYTSDVHDADTALQTPNLRPTLDRRMGSRP